MPSNSLEEGVSLRHISAYLGVESLDTTTLYTRLTSRSLREKFGTIQMLEVHLPTTDRRERVFRRYTQPERDHEMLLAQLGWKLPSQSRSRITQKGRLGVP